MPDSGQTAETSREELAERARDLVPVLRERAPQAEKDRRLPDITHQEFLEAGFFRMFQPRRYGGYELSWDCILDVAAELGRGCGSSCWVFTNLTGQSWINGMKCEQAQDDVWADNPDAVIASSFPGKGASVKVVDGGWVADGIWGFSSGIDFADWSNVQLFVPQENGPPQHQFALVPKTDFSEMVDDWNPSGLAGTGSRSFVLENVFIPEHRAIPAAQVQGGPTPGSAVNPNPLYKIPLFAMGTKQFASTAYGVAIGALDSMWAELATRKSVGGIKLSEQGTVQARVAEASAELEAARALMQEDFRESNLVAETDDPPTQEQRARWRRNNAFAGKLCVQAVERLFPLAGGRGLGFDSPYQRAVRDVHAATSQNSMAWDVAAIMYAQQQFGAVISDPRYFPDAKKD
ncbi:MAG: monooxygenase [Rhodospirillaceae bacterium]|nr:monooxygenase [Rhodospirillaceae bacterium]|tara:strand:+ start:1530 stop:2744 length:1215 start_codon:yes stop_codon:yes gene_type:complete